MKKLILFLSIMVMLLGCKSNNQANSTGLRGYWKYIGESNKNEVNLFYVKDSTISYILENVGIYTYRYQSRNDSILFEISKDEISAVSFQFFGNDQMLIKGARIDTLRKLPLDTGVLLSNKVKSKAVEHELITPD